LKQEFIKLSLNGFPLAGVLTRPHTKSIHAVLLLHPHPLFGGNMDNHVVKWLEDTFLDLGYTTFRFNFRGVSNSSSGFTGIASAVEDTNKAIELMERYELNSLGLVGYSFGGSTALRIVSSRSVTFLVTLSASYTLFLEGGYDVSQLTRIECPVLMFHGQSDRMIPHADLRTFSSRIAHIKAVSLENEDHFYQHAFPQVVHEIRSFISDLQSHYTLEGYP
jgi:alpha/beta superfamily hydrolase